MKLRVKAIFAVAAIVAAQLLSAPARAADDVPMFLPGDAKVPYQLNQCVLPDQLDCIESVIVSRDGVTDQATFVEYKNRPDSIDYDGNKRLNDRTIWSAPSNFGVEPIELDAELFPLKYSFPLTGNKRTFAAGLRVRMHGNWEDFTTRFMLRVRTSWLVPQSVGIAMGDPEFKQQKIPGGNLWIIGGTRNITYNYNGDFEKKLGADAKADTLDANATFSINHAYKDKSLGVYGSSECAESGYMVFSNNAPSGSTPSYNYKTRSLDFNIWAPHKTTEGKLNRGYFYLWVNKEYIRCMWPKSGLDKAKNFTVSVYNEDGSKQVATTTVVYKKGQLRVAAVNFHYSSPTIRLKAKK